MRRAGRDEGPKEQKHGKVMLRERGLFKGRERRGSEKREKPVEWVFFQGFLLGSQGGDCLQGRMLKAGEEMDWKVTVGFSSRVHIGDVLRSGEQHRFLAFG